MSELAGGVRGAVHGMVDLPPIAARVKPTIHHISKCTPRLPDPKRKTHRTCHGINNRVFLRFSIYIFFFFAYSISAEWMETPESIKAAPRPMNHFTVIAMVAGVCWFLFDSVQFSSVQFIFIFLFTFVCARCEFVSIHKNTRRFQSESASTTGNTHSKSIYKNECRFYIFVWFICLLRNGNNKTAREQNEKEKKSKKLSQR